VVSSTPGSDDSGVSEVVGFGDAGTVVVAVATSARTAVPSLLREHAATPGTARIAAVAATHTSRITTSVWRGRQSLAKAAASSRSESTYGVPETSTTTLAIVPPVKSYGASYALDTA